MRKLIEIHNNWEFVPTTLRSNEQNLETFQGSRQPCYDYDLAILLFQFESWPGAQSPNSSSSTTVSVDEKEQVFLSQPSIFNLLGHCSLQLDLGPSTKTGTPKCKKQWH